MKKTILEDFNLPKYVKGKTFAEASKAINKKFKDRTDRESVKTKEELLQRLAKAQEYVKMQQSLKANSQEMPSGNEMPQSQPMGQPNMQNAFAMGGPIDGENTTSSVDSSKISKPTSPTISPFAYTMLTGTPQEQALVQKDMKPYFTPGTDIYNANSKGETMEEHIARNRQVMEQMKKEGTWKDYVTTQSYDPNKYSNKLAPYAITKFEGSPEEQAKADSFMNNYFSVDTRNSPNLNRRGETREQFLERQRALYEKMKQSGELDKYREENPMQYPNSFAEGGTMDMLNQFLPQVGQDTAALGNTLNAANAAGGVMGGGNPLGIASTGMSFANEAFGKTGIDTSGKQGYQASVNEGAKTASGALKGAQAGMALGPWGAAGGALIGGVAGALGGKKANKDIQNANANAAIIANNKFDNNFAGGGPMDFSTVLQGAMDTLNGTKVLQTPNNQEIMRTGTVGNVMDTAKISDPMNIQQQGAPWAGGNPSNPTSNPSKLKEFGNKALDWMGDNYGEVMRYTPVVGEMFNKIEKPTTARGERLDNRYERQLFDENSLVNRINQNNVNGALTEASGGDLGALRNNILAGNLNKDKAISDAMLKGSDINRAENRTAQEFNANIDRTNMNQEERYIERKARDEGAYATAKDAKRRAILEDIGKIGKEESDKKLVKTMTGYKWNGKYWVDKKGNKVDPSQLPSTSPVSNVNMFGGYLKNKKSK